MTFLRDEKGFSLAELLVGMLVAALVVMAAATTFEVQSRVATVQEGISDLHLGGQVSLDLLERDIRMAGYNASKSTALVAETNAVSADPDRAQNTDGVFVRYSSSSRNHYRYYIAKADNSLTRQNLLTNALETIAPNVEDLQLSYTLNDGSTTTNPADPTRIRQVDVSILVKSSKRDPAYTVAAPVIGNGIARPADGFRRRVFRTSVSPRNFGLD